MLGETLFTAKSGLNYSALEIQLARDLGLNHN